MASFRYIYIYIYLYIYACIYRYIIDWASHGGSQKHQLHFLRYLAANPPRRGHPFFRALGAFLAALRVVAEQRSSIASHTQQNTQHFECLGNQQTKKDGRGRVLPIAANKSSERAVCHCSGLQHIYIHHT